MNNYYLSILFLLISQFVYSQGGACPQVFASQDQTLPCTQTCANISATVFDVGETTTYDVNSIPHSPPIAYNAGGGTGVSVGTDDVWSPIINLPFPFCYFGQTYTTCKIGSNGGLIFAPTTGGGYNPWPFSASVPSPALSSAGHVFGPYHDIDPSVAGSVKYFLQGAAPCRKLIVIFNDLGHYSCTSLRSTHMMVLYETTNIIEVYIEQKETCTGWNGGRAVVGIQNTAGSLGYTPPGRNTGVWTVSTPEAWQFKPSGAPIYSTIEWLENGLVIDSGNTISICPSPPSSTYTARTTYTRCDGLQIVETDDVTIDFVPTPTVVIDPLTLFTCSGQTTTLQAYSLTTVDYLWSPGGATSSSINVSPGASTTYTVTVTDTATGCTDQAMSTINIAAPVANSCNVLYVTPSALPSGSGTKANPIDLSSALEIGACNGTTIKMAIGNYVTDTAITGITSYLTLEGGFDDSVNWEKVSTVGGTRILRTATMSTSLATGSNSIIYGTGIQNESGPDPKIVAIDISNQVGFRFQDITIETEDLGGQASIETYQGVSTYGIQLTACSDYDFVRTNIQTGGASNGYNQVWSYAATNGGSSYGINATTNGANGNIINCNISAGVFGTGGVGTPSGTDGISSNITVTGTALATQDDNFNLAGQSIIRMEDISCTNTTVGFSSFSSNSWTFGANSTPISANGDIVNTQYSTIGRKDINYGTDLYTGFSNILLDDQIIPAFTTNAPLVLGQYRVCAGDFVGFSADNGGVGYVYEWDLGGAALPNTYSGANFNTIGANFNTPGVYTISLNYVTNCCGASVATTIDIFVEEKPLLVVPVDVGLCFGENASTSLTVTGITTGGTVNWSPPTGLNRIDSTTVVALPLSTTNYIVTLMDSSGVCNSTDSININVVDLLLDTATTDANCVLLGTANVNVLPSDGASGNYSYAWSSGDNTQMISGLQPDTYSVIVTDNILGCTDSIDAIVNPGPGALFGSANSTDISCFGKNDGKIVVTIQGGTPPYTYAWSNGTTNSNTTSLTDSIENLSAGNYDLIITDALGCYYEISSQVEEPSQIVFSLDSIRQPTCVGIDDGVIVIRPDGGVRPYSFIWTNGIPVVELYTDVIAYNLTSDSYTLVLTDSTGCQDSVSVTLEAPLVSDTINDTICSGASYLTPSGVLTYPIADSLILDTIPSFIGCDSVVLVNLTVNPSFSGLSNMVTICEGNNYILPSGDTAFISGTYIDTLNTITGCDSILTTQLLVQSVDSVLIDTTLCSGESLTLNGNSYSISGQYFDTLRYNGTGCDSLRYDITILVDTVIISSIDTSICQGENILVNGQMYDSTGIYYDTIRFVNSGCDSVQFIIDLTVNAVYNDTIFPEICANETYILPDASTVNTSGIHHYADTTINGCDSLFTVNLIVNPLPLSPVNISICIGDSIFLGGSWQHSAGVFIDTFAMTSPACDTIITTTLSVNTLPSVVANANDTNLCQGETLILNGSGANTYAWSNGIVNNIGFIQVVGTTTYIVTGEDLNTCVNRDTISVQVNPTYSSTENIVICADELPYVFHDGTTHNVNTNIIYTNNLTSVNNCDSVITTTLTVNNIGVMGSIPDSIIVCESFNQVLNMTSQNMGSFQWQVDDGFGFSNITDGGIYTGSNTNELSVSPLDTSLTRNLYRIIMFDECSNGPFMDSTYFKVSTPHELSNPIEDIERCLEDDALIVVDYNGYNYVWSNGQTGPFLQADESGTYSVEFLELGTNCKMSDEFDVKIEDCVANCLVMAPTGFSPDESSKNDFFNVITTCEEGFSFFEFRIYNRWGEEIFFTDNPTKGWDGSYKYHKAEIGVYSYMVEYVKNLKNEREMLTGNVTLIR